MFAYKNISLLFNKKRENIQKLVDTIKTKKFKCKKKKKKKINTTLRILSLLKVKQRFSVKIIKFYLT